VSSESLLYFSQIFRRYCSFLAGVLALDMGDELRIGDRVRRPGDYPASFYPDEVERVP
jgi:hypothetical protein